MFFSTHLILSSHLNYFLSKPCLPFTFSFHFTIQPLFELGLIFVIHLSLTHLHLSLPLVCFSCLTFTFLSTPSVSRVSSRPCLSRVSCLSSTFPSRRYSSRVSCLSSMLPCRSCVSRVSYLYSTFPSRPRFSRVSYLPFNFPFHHSLQLTFHQPLELF